jgi:hypothetical protein
MKTFKEFLYEIYVLEESSSGERSGKRTRGQVTMARGRGSDMTRQERSAASISKKSGIRGTGKYSTKDLRDKSKEYTNAKTDYYGDRGSLEQDHYITSFASPRAASMHSKLIKKGASKTGGFEINKVIPSKDSVRKTRDLRKSLVKSGANKRGRVHDVTILARDTYLNKNDPTNQATRGKKFIKAIKDTPNQLKKVGAKKGEAVISKPSAMMPRESDNPKSAKSGENKRAKLYKRIFGKKTTNKSNKTGLMVGKVDQ